MRHWWVNQNQTFRHELSGGYLWSPKLKKDGTRNPYYETMREVSPGDLVFSFVDARIRAFGIARSFAYEAPQPSEFGEAGRRWDRVGWRVDVDFHTNHAPLRPADWMALLAPLLPSKYSPLLPDGRGVQNIYLTQLSRPLALQLADLVSTEVGALARMERVAEVEERIPNPEVLLWEEHLRQSIESSDLIPETTRQSLVLARRGQGLFRERVQKIEHHCRITGVTKPEHLRASHCKPWRDSNNEERLDGQNGLLLTPSIDHLFDRGFISFQGDGLLLVSPVAHVPSLTRMGVPVDQPTLTGTFTSGQKRFLEYHRDQVFLRSRISR